MSTRDGEYRPKLARFRMVKANDLAGTGLLHTSSYAADGFLSAKVRIVHGWYCLSYRRGSRMEAEAFKYLADRFRRTTVDRSRPMASRKRMFWFLTSGFSYPSVFWRDIKGEALAW
jgi:hypothetical protein